MFILLSSVFTIVLFFFFFLMIRRPPRSTLFPTRRSSDLLRRYQVRSGLANDSSFAVKNDLFTLHWQYLQRSEEHTSELQSRQYLVCRLLLEKKKKKTLNIENFNI